MNHLYINKNDEIKKRKNKNINAKCTNEFKKLILIFVSCMVLNGYLIL